MADLAGDETPGGEGTLLQDALRGAAAALTPRKTARAIVGACVERLGATAGGFYRLDLSTGAQVPFVRPEGVPDVEIPANRVRLPEGQISSLKHFLEAAGDSDTPTNPHSKGVAVYALRDQTCIGVLRLDGIEPSQVDDSVRQDLFAVTSMLSLVYENEFAFNLLSKLQRPLDFDRPEQKFFALIAELIMEASGMEFVALREHRDGNLKCIALAGFGDDPKLSDWDWESLDEYPDFRTALFEAKTVAVDALDPKRHAALIAQPWSKNVRSFVAIPVNVGNEVFGVLSVAARCEFNYSQVELRGFESIANAVGVSITNFRNSRQLGVRAGEYLETAMALTGLEVARSVKHEALNYTTIANTGLRNLWVRLGKPERDADVDYVGNALSRLGASLNEITKAPSTAAPGDWKRIGLKQVWKEARVAMGGRLEEERIDVRDPQTDATVYAQPDWLRQVFLNLLLNSIDAFREGKKSGRRIDLQITPPSQRSGEIQFSFSDNAIGINPHRLYVPPGTPDLPVEQRIFQEGVTSKKSGSGFGLWLVRHILDDHRASIDLTNYRGGVTFVLRFRRPEEAEAMLKEKA